MFFLLRIGFWLAVVCVLLPSGGAKQTSPDAQIDAVQAVTLASAAVSDVRGFCERQPDACVVGGKVATAIGHKAEAGARTIYEFISAKLSEPPATTDVAATKAATSPAPRVVPVSATGSTGNRLTGGTLTPADMQPAWHAPVPLPPRREPRSGRPSA
jgi:hypothetical protein